jgi:hypothetical protein
VKKKASPRSSRRYSEQQLSGLHSSTAARKQETVERLRMAIEVLQAKKQAISAQTIYAECGLHYASLLRNPEAIALFRANSTHLKQKKKRTRRQRKTSDDTLSQPSPRDPLFNYKKPQLVMRLREAQQHILDLERQLATLADACLQRDARVVELEAKLTELEPYRNFVEQVRQRVRHEEHEDQR